MLRLWAPVIAIVFALVTTWGCGSSFERSHQRGDLDGMAASLERMAERGTVALGMTSDAVVAVLGTPDTSTGIYVPGGFSLGYNAQESDRMNYHHFYWVHFRAPDWESGDPQQEPVLIGWGL